jgi:hypothetical protein
VIFVSPVMTGFILKDAKKNIKKIAEAELCRHFLCRSEVPTFILWQGMKALPTLGSWTSSPLCGGSLDLSYSVYRT